MLVVRHEEAAAVADRLDGGGLDQAVNLAADQEG